LRNNNVYAHFYTATIVTLERIIIKLCARLLSPGYTSTPLLLGALLSLQKAAN